MHEIVGNKKIKEMKLKIIIRNIQTSTENTGFRTLEKDAFNQEVAIVRDMPKDLDLIENGFIANQKNLISLWTETNNCIGIIKDLICGTANPEMKTLGFLIISAYSCKERNKHSRRNKEHEGT